MLTVPGAAVGRRKQAIARVRLVPGAGTITVNGRTFEDYFPNKLHQQLVNDPFTVLNLDRRATTSSRASPVVAPRARPARCVSASHGRSTGSTKRTTAPTLKKAGFLSRDARVKERKKAGLKKARKAPQYSKR